MHLVFEASGAGIFGVDRRLFTRSLSGLGLAFGVRFLAGCFRPFWQAPISQLTDRVVSAARLFGPQADRTRQAIMRVASEDARDARDARDPGCPGPGMPGLLGMPGVRGCPGCWGCWGAGMLGMLGMRPMRG